MNKLLLKLKTMFLLYSILLLLSSILISLVNGEAKIVDKSCVDPSLTTNYALGIYIIYLILT